MYKFAQYFTIILIFYMYHDIAKLFYFVLYIISEIIFVRIKNQDYRIRHHPREYNMK